jgi:MFS family permease
MTKEKTLKNSAFDVPHPNPNYRWYVVGMLWCIAFFNYADRQALSVSLPLIEKEMHLTSFQLGLISSAFAWIYGLGAPFAGIIVDRVRRKSAILFGLCTWSIICALTALSRTGRQLFAFMAAEGMGETFYFPASMSIISDYHGKATRSRAMGLHQTSVYTGTILGSVFAGLIGQYFGWRYSFVIFGSMGLILAMVLHIFLREPKRGAADAADQGKTEVPPAPRVSSREAIKVILTTPTVLYCLAGFICANFVAAVVLSWMAKFLRDRFDLNLAVAGLSATAFLQVASMLGAPLSGWLADRLRRRTPRGRMLVQALGVFGAAPFVVLCGMTHDYTVMMIGLCGWGFFKGIYDANIFASAYDVIRPEARGAAAGIMNAVGWLGGGGGPALVGYLASFVELGAAIAMGAVMYIVAGIMLLIGAIFYVKRDSARLQQEMTPPAE